MLFEVLKNDVIVACTDQISCIYNDSQLKDLSRAGFTFRLNGKEATLNKVKSFRQRGVD